MLPLIAQTITFTSTPPTPGRPGIAYTVTATGGHSGNPVVFSLPGPSAGVCSLRGDGFTVDLIGAGT